jgi:hypothetical protein
MGPKMEPWRLILEPLGLTLGLGGDSPWSRGDSPLEFALGPLGLTNGAVESRPGAFGLTMEPGWRLTLGPLRICRLMLQIHIALTRIWDPHKISRIRFASVLRIRIRTYG